MINTQIIGKKAIANIGLDKDWISYSNGNDGEENQYRDAYSNDGRLIYCDGETCIVEAICKVDSTITLSNENIIGVFTIPYYQFESDFVIQ